MTAPSPWLTREEVAERLRISPSTIAEWAVKGTGPKYAKFGRHVRYRITDVEAWENEQFGDES